MKYFCLMLSVIIIEVCNGQATSPTQDPFVVVLGTLQDGGSPHMGCQKDCCKVNDPHKKVVSLGLIDPASNKKFLFEATPDFVWQTSTLNGLLPSAVEKTPDEIFITHAHIGHYSGLMFLGREAMNSKDVLVYAMPKMKRFLEKNGPWSQLVSLKNIQIKPLSEGNWESIGPSLRVKPILVPHRDEFSETVGFIIEGPHKKLLFIPDIDKWEKWRTDIVSLIREVDHALIDGTFFSTAELGNRNIAEIPHPLVQESMQLFDALPAREKEKIMFIHFNHTNPLLNEQSEEARLLKSKGFRIAEMNLRIKL